MRSSRSASAASTKPTFGTPATTRACCLSGSVKRPRIGDLVGVALGAVDALAGLGVLADLDDPVGDEALGAGARAGACR